MHVERSRPLYFWQQSASIHQAPLIAALSGPLNQEVRVVVAEDVPERRKDHGWGQTHYGAAGVTISPSWRTWKDIARSAPRDALHLVGGAGVYPIVGRATRWLAVRRRHVYVMSEPWDPRTDSGVRKVARRARFASVAPWCLDGFLATGDLAHEQFARMKIRADGIQPWGYFPTVAMPEGGMLRTYDAVFVGSLTERKDVGTFLKACTGMDPLRIAIIGDGPEHEQLVAMSRSLMEMGGGVDFLGNLSQELRDKVLAASRTLVLPSRFDGWGAVVNEGLLSGCTSVVSSACGSVALGGGGLPVYAFEAGDSQGLRSALQSALRDPRSRDEVRRLALDQISPRRAAEYLLEFLQSKPDEKVLAPWLSKI